MSESASIKITRSVRFKENTNEPDSGKPSGEHASARLPLLDGITGRKKGGFVSASVHVPVLGTVVSNRNVRK